RQRSGLARHAATAGKAVEAARPPDARAPCPPPAPSHARPRAADRSRRTTRKGRFRTPQQRLATRQRHQPRQPLRLRTRHRSAERRKPVVAPALVLVRRRLIRRIRHQTLRSQPLQRRVERAGTERARAAGLPLYLLQNRVTVAIAISKREEDGQ